MKLSFLRQINACICLDRYEGGGLLCNGLILCFFCEPKWNEKDYICTVVIGYIC